MYMYMHMCMHMYMHMYMHIGTERNVGLRGLLVIDTYTWVKNTPSVVSLSVREYYKKQNV